MFENFSFFIIIYLHFAGIEVEKQQKIKGISESFRKCPVIAVLFTEAEPGL